MSSARKKEPVYNKEKMMLISNQMHEQQIADEVAGKPRSWCVPYFDREPRYLALLNQECKMITEFGIGVGFQTEFADQLGWKTTGYDYSTTGNSFLKKSRPKTIIRECDLSCANEYKSFLEEDLQKPTNIVALHTLEYLIDRNTGKDDGMAALLFACMRLAKPGTVFFMVNHVYAPHYNKEREPLPVVKSVANTHLRAGLVPSFFAPRIDFEYVMRSEVDTYSAQSKRQQYGSADFEGYSEIVVVRKR